MKLFVSLIGVSIIGTLSAFRLDCMQRGECLGGIPITNAEVERAEACYEYCQGTDGCSDFTFNEDTHICVTFNGCTEVSDDFCSDCLSGQNDYCTNCFIPGQCLGPSLGSPTANDATECRQFCQQRDGCEYYTHFEDNFACLLVSECTIVDETCDGYCIHGQRNCEGIHEEIGSNRIWVLGGFPTINEIDVEIIDFSLGPNQGCPKPSDLPEPMRGAVGAFVNGKIIICGVIGGSNCYLYSFQTRSWSRTVSWGSDRSDSSSVVIDENTWWIAGGFGGSYLDSSLIYNGVTFQPGPKLPYANYAACALKVNETHVFMAGGYAGSNYISSAYLLNWEDEVWTPLKNMSTGRRSHTCNLVGTDVIVTGGYDGDYLGTSEIFSLTTLTWSMGPGVPTTSGVYAFGKSVQSRDSFRIVGGYDGNKYLDDVFEFDPNDYKWINSTKKMASAREDHVVLAIPEDDDHC